MLSIQPSIELRHELRHESSPFAQKMKALRRRLGSKQCWVANVVGCTNASVSFWESGKRVPDLRNLERLLHALEMAGATRHEIAWLRDAWEAAKYPDLVGTP